MFEFRIKFSKTERAVYLSHLDLMRTLQRAAVRAGLPLRHTEGFNPRPKMNILIPLSLGFESGGELCDFSLSEEVRLSHVPERLNAALPEGIRVISAYPSGRPVREIAAAEYEIKLIYDNGAPLAAAERASELFSRDEIPFIKKLSVFSEKNILCINAVLSAGAESLNPSYLVGAIEKHLPEYKSDFSQIRRKTFFDKELIEFK